MEYEIAFANVSDINQAEVVFTLELNLKLAGYSPLNLLWVTLSVTASDTLYPFVQMEQLPFPVHLCNSWRRLGIQDSQIIQMGPCLFSLLISAEIL